MSFRTYLKVHSACEPAVKWVGYKKFEAAWNQCPRGEWLLWLAVVSGNLKLAVRTMCKIIASEMDPKVDGRAVFDALRTLKRWSWNKTLAKDVEKILDLWPPEPIWISIRGIAYAVFYQKRHDTTQAAGFMSIAYDRIEERSTTTNINVVRDNIPMEAVLAKIEKHIQ